MGIIGEMVKKDSPIIEAIGTLDELQAVISVVRYQLSDIRLDGIIRDIGNIMSGKKTEVNLETEIKKQEKKVKPVNKFVIFSDKKAVYLNWIRTIVRRAERRMVALKNKEALEYLNKLSKYLYLLARKAEEK